MNMLLENEAKEVIEQKFSQLDEFTGSIEDNWRKMKETLLDDTGKNGNSSNKIVDN